MINELAEMYIKIGSAGVLAVTFAFMIMNLIKSQRLQTINLDQIMKDLTKLATEMSNTQSIVIKLVDRLNRSDDSKEKFNMDIIKEINDVSDVLMEIKGNVARINH